MTEAVSGELSEKHSRTITMKLPCEYSQVLMNYKIKRCACIEGAWGDVQGTTVMELLCFQEAIEDTCVRISIVFAHADVCFQGFGAWTKLFPLTSM